MSDLSDVEKQPVISKKRHRPVKADEDEEEAYERKPRRQRIWKDDARNATLLPVILPSGESIVSKVAEAKSLKGKKEEMGEDSRDGRSGNEEEKLKMSKKQQRRLGQLKRGIASKEKAQESNKKILKDLALFGGLKDMKQIEAIKKILSKLKTHSEKLKEIALSSELIVSCPETNLYRFYILFSLVRDKTVCRNLTSKSNHHRSISTIALISLGSVFKNIIPGYKIHVNIDDTNGNQKLSHAVQKLHSYENLLINCFGQFVSFLQSVAPVMPDIVCSIICELLHASPSFNYSDELLDLCIKLACLAPDSKDGHTENSLTFSVSIKASDCLLSLIQKDSTLDLAVRVARVVGKVAKSSASNKTPNSGGKKTLIHGNLLSVLSKIDFSDKEASVRREAELRGIRKGEKISKEVMRDLHASSIYGDIRKFKKNQTEILTELFVTFLRILRSPHLFPSDALPGCLEGLGRLSHLVNVELVSEISNELQQLILKQNNKLEPYYALEAITAIVRLTKVTGAILNIDVSWVLDQFCNILEGCVPFLVSDPLSTPSIVQLPFKSISLPQFSIDSSPSINPISPDPKSLLPEVHPEDRSTFLYLIKESIELILTCPSICGTTTGTTPFSNRGMLKLLDTLLNICSHLADPICRITILKLVTTIVENSPNLGSAFDIEGTVLYGTGEEKSFYWTTGLLSSCIGTQSSTLAASRMLKSFAS